MLVEIPASFRGGGPVTLSIDIDADAARQRQGGDEDRERPHPPTSSRPMRNRRISLVPAPMS